MTFTLQVVEDMARTVYAALGPGYSERVYHNAIEVLLRTRGIPYESERVVPIVFQGHTIGNLRADLIVNQRVVLEFKSIKSMSAQAETQAVNYLKLTGLAEAYLVNFPPCGTNGVEIRAVSHPDTLG